MYMRSTSSESPLTPENPPEPGTGHRRLVAPAAPPVAVAAKPPLLPRRDVTPLDRSPEAAAKPIISGGLVAPPPASADPRKVANLAS